MKGRFLIAGLGVILLLFLQGCLGNGEIRVSEPRVELSDFISVSVVGKSEKGVVVENTGGYDDRPRLMYCVRPYFKGDFNGSLLGLAKGKDTTFRVSVDSLLKYAYDPVLESLASRGFINYKVRVNEIVKRSGRSDSLFNVAVEQLKARETGLARQREAGKISRYVAVNPFGHRMGEENIHYNVLVEGTGGVAEKGSRVKVYYSLASLDGKVFETNISQKAASNGIYNRALPYLPIEVEVAEVAGSGFELLLAKMRLNTQIAAVLPSRYAYGAGGNRFLPAYAPVLVYLHRVR